jgi:hypothetical protein
MLKIKSETKQATQHNRQMVEKEFNEGTIPVAELSQIIEISSKAASHYEVAKQYLYENLGFWKILQAKSFIKTIMNHEKLLSAAFLMLLMALGNKDCQAQIARPDSALFITIAYPDSPIVSSYAANEENRTPAVLRAFTWQNAVIDWYDTPVGGKRLAIATNVFVPSQTGTYYAEARFLTSGRVSFSRTPGTFTIAKSLTPIITVRKIKK